MFPEFSGHVWLRSLWTCLYMYMLKCHVFKCIRVVLSTWPLWCLTGSYRQANWLVKGMHRRGGASKKPRRIQDHHGPAYHYIQVPCCTSRNTIAWPPIPGLIEGRTAISRYVRCAHRGIMCAHSIRRMVAEGAHYLHGEPHTHTCQARAAT